MHHLYFFLPGILETAIKFLFRLRALGLLEKQVEQVVLDTRRSNLIHADYS